MISTRGRYAIRIMIDLAEKNSAEYVRLKDLSDNQNISLKYLESITTMLSKSGLIEAAHGKGGGYKLNKSPEDYTIGEILRVTEGSLAPVACLECGAKPCDRAAVCRTLPMWKKFDSMINNFFDSVSIADLMKQTTDVGYFGASL
ncbi:MAG: Rrf2 family transcriptional regulator [Bacteroidales bacterium]|nr:Rrf2 family transcriptional regulator [Bacteroidales bacterium]